MEKQWQMNVLTKIHAREDAGVGTRSVGVEHLDCDKVDSLSNTKGPAANSARYVTTMSVLIGVLQNE